MPFDGRDHADATLLYPANYGPGPGTAVIPGEALRTAYLYARHHGRMLWHFTSGWDFDVPAKQVVSAVAFTRLKGGRHLFLDEMTDVIVAGQFRMISGLPATASLRARITDGVATSVGAILTIENSQQGEAQSRRVTSVFSDANHTEDVFTPFGMSTQVHDFLVSVATVPAPVVPVADSLLEGFAAESGLPIPIEIYTATAYWAVID